MWIFSDLLLFWMNQLLVRKVYKWLSQGMEFWWASLLGLGYENYKMFKNGPEKDPWIAMKPENDKMSWIR
jgi:hypothetical protein